MRYYRIRTNRGEDHLAAEAEDGRLTSLTSINEEVREFRDLLRASYITGQGTDDIARHILSGGDGQSFDLSALIEESKSGSGDARLISPLVPDEMWAGGMGNLPVSPELMETLPEPSKVAVEGDRAAYFYKGTGSRLVGPFDNIGIRSDTERTSAEGELVAVIYKGRVVAYSTGVEVAGGLLAQTWWYSVPSKVFKGCASLATCVVTPESLPEPTSRKIGLTITRGGREEARKDNTTEHRKSPEDIAQWIVGHDTPPDLSIVYTGGLVAAGPLEVGDVVRVELEGIGFAENTVEQV